MTFDELRDFLLGFEASEVREDAENGYHIFEVNLTTLGEIWREKLDSGAEMGDFERQTAQKILAKTTIEAEEKAIFAILHPTSPIKIDMRTGSALAKTLRDKHESVVPSKLMNEREWNMIIGFGQVQPSEMIDLLRLSYRLATEA